jgi:myo-inositol-1-phosphate synthase
MYRDIGGYGPEHIKFAAAFDIDVRKVNKTLQEALRAHPNCAMDHVAEISDVCMVEGGVVVREGPLLDGVPPHMADYPDDVTFVPSNASPLSMADVVDELKKQRVDVVVNYLPVGSSEASKFYIDAALEVSRGSRDTWDARALDLQYYSAAYTSIPHRPTVMWSTASPHTSRRTRRASSSSASSTRA